MGRNFLVLDRENETKILRAIGSPARIAILRLLNRLGPQNVSTIARHLDVPQSSVSANVQILEDIGLIRTEMQRARKGSQKVCHGLYDELLLRLGDGEQTRDVSVIDVEMPVGLYTSCEVTAPCGLCAPDGVIGLLDVPDSLLDPQRMGAGLVWFTRGFVEYQFPNNARLTGAQIESLSFSMELSSEVPGTGSNWPSDITVSVNDVEVGTWTSPGDYGDRRGTHTPDWWKLRGSQYGALKHFRVDRQGSFIDDDRASDITVSDLDLDSHRSIRLRIAVRDDARFPGGVNIFGRNFGDHDQSIIMRITTQPRTSADEST